MSETNEKKWKEKEVLFERESEKKKFIDKLKKRMFGVTIVEFNVESCLGYKFGLKKYKYGVFPRYAELRDVYGPVWIRKKDDTYLLKRTVGTLFQVSQIVDLINHRKLGKRGWLAKLFSWM